MLGSQRRAVLGNGLLGLGEAAELEQRAEAQAYRLRLQLRLVGKRWPSWQTTYQTVDVTPSGLNATGP